MKRPEVIAKEVIEARGSSNAVYALRLLCETYNQEELHEAKNHFNCISTDPLGMVVLEAINRLRHKELTDRLVALEKPHWTLVPTFWVVMGTFVLGIVSLVIAIFAWRDPLPLSEDIPSNRLSPNPRVTTPAQEMQLLPPASTRTNLDASPASEGR